MYIDNKGKRYPTIVFLSLCCMSCWQANSGRSSSDNQPNDDTVKSNIPNIPICYKDYNLFLGDNLKVVTQKFDHLRVDHMGRYAYTESPYKDYFSISEPSIMLSNGQMNPSVFTVFDQHSRLINFMVVHLCDAPKTDDTKTEIIEKLAATALPCLDKIADKTTLEITAQDYFIKWELDTDSSNAYWCFRYEIGLNETQ